QRRGVGIVRSGSGRHRYDGRDRPVSPRTASGQRPAKSTAGCPARPRPGRVTIHHVPTLSEKVWERHVVRRAEGEPDLLYVDLHLVHEVTSPQAFDGLRMNGRSVRRPDLAVATIDHNNPTTGLDQPVQDPISAKQMAVLAQNCEEFGI